MDRLNHKNQKDVKEYVKDRCILHITEAQHGDIRMDGGWSPKCTRDYWDRQYVFDLRTGTVPHGKIRGKKHYVGKKVESEILTDVFESPSSFASIFQYQQRLKERYDGREFFFKFAGEKLPRDPYNPRQYMSEGDAELPRDEADLRISCTLEWL